MDQLPFSWSGYESKVFAASPGDLGLLVGCSFVPFVHPARIFADDAPAAADNQQQQQTGRFVRYVDDNKGGGQLQTAIVSYTDGQGHTVNLVAAVHIADPAFYQSLNKFFATQDAVLYELVAPKDSGPPQPNASPQSLIGIVQHAMKDVLGLQFQLDGIDYTKANFVHADMDAETFEKMESERGESLWGLMFQQALKQMTDPQAQQDQMDPDQLLAALMAPDRSRQLKLILGKQMQNMEEMSAGLNGGQGTVLVTERNKACFAVLTQQLAAGKKTMAIFYGAAHLPDMDQRLTAMGFKSTGTTWQTAWDMSAPASGVGDAGPAPEAAPVGAVESVGAGRAVEPFDAGHAGRQCPDRSRCSCRKRAGLLARSDGRAEQRRRGDRSVRDARHSQQQRR